MQKEVGVIELERLIDMLREAIDKLLKGRTRVDEELDDGTKVTAYWAGDIIRVDIKGYKQG